MTNFELALNSHVMDHPLFMLSNNCHVYWHSLYLLVTRISTNCKTELSLALEDDDLLTKLGVLNLEQSIHHLLSNFYKFVLGRIIWNCDNEQSVLNHIEP